MTAYLSAENLGHLRAYVSLKPGVDGPDTPYVCSCCQRSSQKQYCSNRALDTSACSMHRVMLMKASYRSVG